MNALPPIDDPAAEWRSVQLLYALYTTLAREFTIDLPACTELEIGGDAPEPEFLEVGRVWLLDTDKHIPVHQLRQFFQTSRLADEKALRTVLTHHLRKPEHDDSDRDKIDFLLVQFFSVCAPSPLEDTQVSLEFVAGILAPILGSVEPTLPASLQPLEELVQAANACESLQEVFNSGILERGRKLKAATGSDYFAPAALAAFARFNFLMRRVFFRLMHQDLNAILDGLRDLDLRGVATLDCRKADFSADEPVARLRMICQSWKIMFQAEYAFGQPMRLLVDLRAVIEAALVPGAGQTEPPPTVFARAAAAAAGAQPAATGALADDDPNLADDLNLEDDGQA
jgi:hypothetical protein